MKTTKFEAHHQVPADFTGIAEFPSGHLEWYKNGVTHRRDGPAVIFITGEKWFYLDGWRKTPQEIFEQLTPEEKEKAIWELDLWR